MKLGSDRKLNVAQILGTDKKQNNTQAGDRPVGCTLIFSFIRKLRSFFKVQSFEFQYFWGFQKNEYFLGCEDFVDDILGSSQNWTMFRGQFYALLGAFLKVKVQNGGYFWGLLKFQIFLGCLKFMTFLSES